MGNLFVVLPTMHLTSTKVPQVRNHLRYQSINARLCLQGSFVPLVYKPILRDCATKIQHPCRKSIYSTFVLSGSSDVPLPKLFLGPTLVTGRFIHTPR